MVELAQLSRMGWDRFVVGGVRVLGLELGGAAGVLGRPVL